MLTRRHIRAKVMQALYALKQDIDLNSGAVKKFLDRSMNDMYDLFLLDISLLLSVKDQAEEFFEKSKKKYLPTQEDIHPNLKFINNALLKKIEECQAFADLLDKKKLNDWQIESSYTQLLWEELRNSQLYKTYTASEKTTFKEDRDFVVRFYKEIIAPNEKLHDYFEDKKLTWMDDMAIINTTLIKLLNKQQKGQAFFLPSLFKNTDDREFAFNLYNRTLNYNHDFEEEISKMTPNWDQDRLAEIDMILIKMALCEFTYFPSIPIKVTINEYIEIAKDYSTPKSNIFVNGVLDRISKVYQEEGKINKTGRGLL